MFGICSEDKDFRRKCPESAPRVKISVGNVRNFNVVGLQCLRLSVKHYYQQTSKKINKMLIKQTNINMKQQKTFLFIYPSIPAHNFYTGFR
jgi:hypothetical protein